MIFFVNVQITERIDSEQFLKFVRELKSALSPDSETEKVSVVSSDERTSPFSVQIVAYPKSYDYAENMNLHFRKAIRNARDSSGMNYPVVVETELKEKNRV